MSLADSALSLLGQRAQRVTWRQWLMVLVPPRLAGKPRKGYMSL
jgi:hypothetical protein